MVLREVRPTMLMLLSFAFAQTAAPVLVDQAIGRIETGDYDGALILLETSATAPDADPDRITYLQGVATELDGDPAAAIALYDEGRERWPDSPLSEDRLFRTAEAQATLGEWRRSLRTLRRLDEDAYTGDDRVKLDLVRGIALVGAGRERKGLRLLGDSLAAAEPGQVTFYQAKARMAWAEHLADEAAELDLTGRDKKVVSRLEERATLLAEVEQQVTAAARLQEPEWVLEGLLILGRSYESVASDLLSSSRPRSLTDSQLAEYEALLNQRAMVVFTKASRHLGSGVDLATRLAWQSRRVEALRQAKAEVDARIEALDRAG